MSDSFEGDVIRPLGLVTLYFGYAEYELDLFLERLASAVALDSAWPRKTVGQKLGLLRDAVAKVNGGDGAALRGLLVEARRLFERRNLVTHSCILAGGRVTSGRPHVDEWQTTAEELIALAEQIFTWKEHLHVYRFRHVEPRLTQLLTE